MRVRTAEAPGPRRRASGSARATLTALALLAAFCFTGLSNHPLRASDEPRVAGIAWEMQNADRSFVPHLGNEPFLEHPPLFYALLGEFIGRLGASEGVARLPGALASAATLLLVFALGSRLASPAAGIASLLALVCMRGFFRYSHKVLVDPLLMLCVAIGFYAYVRAVWREPDLEGESDLRSTASWLLVVYVAAGLAFYVKGLIGIVALGGPLALDAAIGRRRHALLSPAHLFGLPFLALVCVSWPWWLHHVEGEAAVREFLLQNGLYRVVPGAGAYAGGHVHAWWYYLPRIPEQVGWPLLFAPMLALWLRRGDGPAGWNLSGIRFLAWILPVGVVLLSIPGTKRGLYLLPFLPPFAIAIGTWIAAATMPGFVVTASRVERVVAPWGLRLLAVGFAASLAWNLFAYPVVRLHRDLGPFARAVEARVGNAALGGYRLPEDARGALAFYSGRIVVALHDREDLHRYLEPGGRRFVLAWSETGADLGPLLDGAVTRSWTLEGGERSYELYAVDAAERAPAP